METREGRILISQNTTISNPIPSIAPIYLLIFYPYVELIARPKKFPLAARFYKKTEDNQVELDCTYALQFKISEDDVKQIQTLRKNFNDQHISEPFKIKAKVNTDAVDVLMGKARNPLNPSRPWTIPLPLTLKFPRNVFLVTEIAMTPPLELADPCE